MLRLHLKGLIHWGLRMVITSVLNCFDPLLVRVVSLTFDMILMHIFAPLITSSWKLNGSAPLPICIIININLIVESIGDIFLVACILHLVRPRCIWRMVFDDILLKLHCKFSGSQLCFKIKENRSFTVTMFYFTAA